MRYYSTIWMLFLVLYQWCPLQWGGSSDLSYDVYHTILIGVVNCLPLFRVWQICFLTSLDLYQQLLAMSMTSNDLDLLEAQPPAPLSLHLSSSQAFLNLMVQKWELVQGGVFIVDSQRLIEVNKLIPANTIISCLSLCFTSITHDFKGKMWVRPSTPIGVFQIMICRVNRVKSN
jgi:hypothetical protein